VSEVERKFLLSELPSGLEARDRVEIEQGYLALDDGAEVRVRLAGAEGTIAAKSGSGLEREEVEVEIDAARARELLEACGSERLRKRRHLVPLGDGLCAEVDVYGGELAGLAVVEVEFPDADRAASFAPPRWFGRELTGDATFANRSLATRGMPDVVATGSSRDYGLSREEAVGEGLRRIVLGRADDGLERLREIESAEADAAEAVHAIRKDMKKARSAVRLLREALPRRDREAANRDLRDAGRALAASREADVKLETLADLAERFDGLPAAALEAWRRILQRDAAAAANTLAAEAALGEARGLIETARAEAERWRLAEAGWEALEAGLGRVYRRGRQALRRAERRGAEEEALHEWRKRAKDLRYALRIVGAAWPRLLEATAKEAHELTDLLGDHHDLAVLRADLEGRALGELESAALRAAILEREEELAAAAFELGRRLYAEPPKAFRRRLRRYWKAWRG
jgi:CYTH domain-containing protein/CHAD domain-containing protein